MAPYWVAQPTMPMVQIKPSVGALKAPHSLFCKTEVLDYINQKW